MLLFYVRHGDPIYDPDSLTPLGHEQAKALSKRFATFGLDKIYASTSNRAIQTAEPTAALLKKQIELLDWANEGNAWTYFTVPIENGGKAWCFHDQKTLEKFNSPAVRALGQAWYTHPDFKDQNFEKGVKTTDAGVDEWLLSLGFAHDRKEGCYRSVGDHPERVALFAHQGMGLVFLSSVLDIPYPQIATHFDFGHSSVTVIRFAGEGKIYPKALQTANDSHLYKEGILTGYHNYIRF